MLRHLGLIDLIFRLNSQNVYMVKEKDLPMPMMRGGKAVLFENFLELSQFVLPVNYPVNQALNHLKKTHPTTQVPINRTVNLLSLC